jgi:hypothetical protein
MRVARRAIAVIGLLHLAACSSPYMKDRGRDGADVLTLTVGFGIGAKARAGPVTTAALFNRDLAGLRGGDAITSHPDDVHVQDGGIPLLVSVDSFLPASEPVKERNKGHYVVTFWTVYPTHQGLFWPEGVRAGPLEDECEDTGDGITPAYYTDLEVVVAAILSVRVGFNPGELVDFLLGFFGVDIYGDDLEVSRNDEPASVVAPRTTNALLRLLRNRIE